MIGNTTRCIDAGRGAVCYRGVTDTSDGAHPLWWSHSAQMEMFFADDLYLSNSSCLDWENLQRHAPCRIMGMSIKGVSTIWSCESLVIYVPIDWRHPFIKYWQPLLAKTTVTCSLPHPEKERQLSVNGFSCGIFGYQGIMLNSTFMTELSTALVGNNRIYRR